ncbi:DUF2989 domain-containing protein [Idiomarina seosinensis]|uniref:DUF2989 domain-containing protein n=1 Tax=Idiomarina seosinensis TaxID=281739 RepID=A0A432ZHV2_9GAMM|nr:DUF2989 domain-containing protein [Idiomarina seosinensis]RUO77551.1 DUF2989 domain-containing protein [Idiomarina seosinensis]
MQIPLKMSFVTLIFSSMIVAACGERMPTVREMCEQDPALCNDLNEDNWCRSERRQLIISRFLHQQNNSAERQYYLLKDLQAYSQCIELASNIEHHKLKDKQSHRIEAYLNSLKAIKKRAEQSANSEAPLLLYWHWANRSDEQALDKLLALEDTKAVQTHELQFALATYYAKQDQQKLLSLLFSALRLYQPEQRFNVEIPESLVTYYLGQEQIKPAYIWSQVAIAFGSRTMNEEQIRAIVNATDDEYDRWQDAAKDIVAEIESGTFNRYPDNS